MNGSNLVSLVCPLMMILMMFMLMRGGKGHGSGSNDNKQQEGREVSCCANHSNDNQNHGDKGHSHESGKKFSRMMMLCCSVPIILVVLMLAVNTVKGTSSSNILTYSLILLCPLSHLVIMPLVMRKRK